MTKTKKTETIVGFFDASCPVCKKRYGWHGTLTDRPACPKCGHNISPQELEDDEKQIKQTDIFCLVQRLWFECKERMAELEIAFIKNMYSKHRKKIKYNKVQLKNIKRLAIKYGVLE